jgi:hypothetical protein
MHRPSRGSNLAKKQESSSHDWGAHPPSTRGANFMGEEQLLRGGGVETNLKVMSSEFY